jgi:hypothetical protein
MARDQGGADFHRSSSNTHFPFHSLNQPRKSRMYGGIHYRFDITAGQNLGQAVARWAIAHENGLD